MPLLTENPVASVFMVAAPNILGSLVRIPISLMMEEYSTRKLHCGLQLVSLVGILGLMILSFATQNMGRLGTGMYFAYLFFGIIGGAGKLRHWPYYKTPRLQFGS